MKNPEDVANERNAELLETHRKVNEGIDQSEKEHGIFSRGIAAEIFHNLGDYTQSGNVPPDVSPYALGRAVRRSIYNNNLDGDYNNSELIRGIFRLTEGQIKEVLELINKMTAENEERIAATRSQLGDSLE